MIEHRRHGFDDLLDNQPRLCRELPSRRVRRHRQGGRRDRHVHGLAHRPARAHRARARRREDLPQPGRSRHRGGLEALVLATHLLNVDRILVVPHTRCAMASNTEDELRDQVGASAGEDASWHELRRHRRPGAQLREDLAKVRSHPLIADWALVGGFIYDVDTGLLQPVGLTTSSGNRDRRPPVDASPASPGGGNHVVTGAG